MAYFSFTNKYFASDPIRVFNNGDFENDLYRDFIYIYDVIEGIELLNNPPEDETHPGVYNISNNTPEKLMKFIETLEKALSGALGRER